MTTTYYLKGFPEYKIINKIMFRKAYCTKSTSCKFQYRAKRQINISLNNGIEGYILVKSGNRKWYSLKNLHKKLIKL